MSARLQIAEMCITNVAFDELVYGNQYAEYPFGCACYILKWHIGHYYLGNTSHTSRSNPNATTARQRKRYGSWYFSTNTSQ